MGYQKYKLVCKSCLFKRERRSLTLFLSNNCKIKCLKMHYIVLPHYFFLTALDDGHDSALHDGALGNTVFLEEVNTLLKVTQNLKHIYTVPWSIIISLNCRCKCSDNGPRPVHSYQAKHKCPLLNF